MVVLTEIERKLLERLAAIGKATQLAAQDLQIAKPLESVGLVFMRSSRPRAGTSSQTEK